MPSIMTLQGPSLGAIPFRRGPSSSTMLLGVTDTIAAHPWVVVAGLFLGGWLATKYAPAWGATWGKQRAAHTRERAFHGRGRGLRGLGMTKTEAYRQFKELYPSESFRSRGYVDRPMRAEAWNNYTDSLAKDRQITMKQYESWTHPWKDR